MADAASFSVMIGMGETYFAAFALALGTGETFAGLVATMPMLVGASLQLATPWFLQRTRSYKRWVILCASLQAAAPFMECRAVRLERLPYDRVITAQTVALRQVITAQTAWRRPR